MLRWLTYFFKSAPRLPHSSSAVMRGIPRLEHLLRTPGRAHYATLVAFAHSVSKDDFISTVHCPSLVGSAIRDGELGGPTTHLSDWLGGSTFQFSPAQVSEFLEGGSVEQTIFLLRKEPNQADPNPPNRFTVGRAKNNDIRIVDFAISRAHAVIAFGPRGYSITDCHSRNGTKVNGRTVRSVAEHLDDGMVISLGRYEFTFLMPETLYERLMRMPFVSTESSTCQPETTEDLTDGPDES